MKKILIIIVLVVAYWACQDVAIGFLDTDNAGYKPDTLLVKTQLDSLGVDAQRVKWGQPWMSYQIQGVEGTKPIYLSIRNVTSLDGGDAESMKRWLKIRNDGTFMIPLDHEITPGRYSISLDFENEGYRKFKDDIFTIIVK